MFAVPGAVLAFGGVSSTAVGAQVYVWDPVRRCRRSESRKRSLASRGALMSGAAVVVTALLGLVLLLGAVAVSLALLLDAGSPTVLSWCRRQQGRPSQLLPHPMPIAAPQPQQLPGHDRHSADASALTDMSTEQLCWVWRRSYTALQDSHSWVASLTLAQDRRRYLDEMERRAPVAFRRWLEGGARAGSDPSSYLAPTGTRARPSTATAVGQPQHRESTAMQIDKKQIIDMLKSKGDSDKATQAESELPDKVDTDKDSGLMSKFGINAQDLMGKLPGGLGGKLPGGLGG